MKIFAPPYRYAQLKSGGPIMEIIDDVGGNALCAGRNNVSIVWQQWLDYRCLMVVEKIGHPPTELSIFTNSNPFKIFLKVQDQEELKKWCISEFGYSGLRVSEKEAVLQDDWRWYMDYPRFVFRYQEDFLLFKMRHS